MIFLSTLIALLIERFFHWSQLRQWRWYVDYQNWLNKKVGQLNPMLMLAVYVLPLALVVGLISLAVSNLLLGLIHVLFGAFILLYCFGPSNLWAQAFQCLGDSKQSVDCARTHFGVSETGNSQSFHQAFLKALFVAADKRIFAVIFWFALLGPLGAVLYRTVAICGSSTGPVADLALKTQKILDWVPVRLFAFLFALAGNFSKAITCWKGSLKQNISANGSVFADCAVAALDLSPDGSIPEDGSAEREALRLIDRTLIITLVILAVLVLLS